MATMSLKIDGQQLRGIMDEALTNAIKEVLDDNKDDECYQWLEEVMVKLQRKTEAAPSPIPLAMEDLRTHRKVWYLALTHCRDASVAGSDRSYWEHEMRAFNRTFDVLVGSEP
jgi:hypothetical protein